MTHSATILRDTRPYPRISASLSVVETATLALTLHLVFVCVDFFRRELYYSCTLLMLFLRARYGINAIYNTHLSSEGVVIGLRLVLDAWFIERLTFACSACCGRRVVVSERLEAY